MTWEIIDRANPDEPGERYGQLARAAQEIARREPPRGRWIARWVDDNGQRTTEDG